MDLNQKQVYAIAQLFINLGIAVFVTFTLGPVLQPDKVHGALFFMLWGILMALPLWAVGIKLSR